MKHQNCAAPSAANTEQTALLKDHSYYTKTAQTIRANARYSRATKALLQGPVDRPKLDKIVGTTNAPMYVLWLRDLGLTIDMERINCRDRDSMRSWYGRYHLDMADREGLRQALTMLGGV